MSSTTADQQLWKTGLQNGMANEESQKVKKNQFGEEVIEETVMTNTDWQKRWEKGQTRFHVPKIHPALVKHYPLLTGGRPAPLRFFLPMCGKTLDMKWLADQGHTVVGVEITELACQQFFKEHELGHVIIPVPHIPGGTVYKSTDIKCNIEIYCCDLFHLTRTDVGEVDCVWDRGSYASLAPIIRERYVPAMLSLINEKTRYLLCSYLFDDTNFAGPPFNAPLANITATYGPSCSIEKVGERDCFSNWQKSWGLEWFIEVVHLILKGDAASKSTANTRIGFPGQVQGRL